MLVVTQVSLKFRTHFCFCLRQVSKNIIRNSSGVKHEYRNRLKIKSSWELFFSLDILTIIVDMTNKKISKVGKELPKNI